MRRIEVATTALMVVFVILTTAAFMYDHLSQLPNPLGYAVFVVTAWMAAYIVLLRYDANAQAAIEEEKLRQRIRQKEQEQVRLVETLAPPRHVQCRSALVSSAFEGSERVYPDRALGVVCCSCKKLYSYPIPDSLDTAAKAEVVRRHTLCKKCQN